MNDLILVYLGEEIVSVVEENSDMHKRYIQRNKESAQKRITDWRKRFDDAHMIYHNFARHGNNLAEFLDNDCSHYCDAYITYKEKGLDAARDSLPFQCLYDVNFHNTALRLYYKQTDIKDFYQFLATFTDEEFYRVTFGEPENDGEFQFVKAPYNVEPPIIP